MIPIGNKSLEHALSGGSFTPVLNEVYAYIFQTLSIDERSF